MIKKAASYLKSVVYPVSRILNNIGAVILIIMMLMVVLDVILRNIFNSPIQGSYELIEYMMVVMVFFFFANSQRYKCNISVTMLVSKLPRRVRVALDVINYLVATVIFVFITMQMYKESILTYTRGDLSAAIFLPHYPFVFFVTLGAFFMTLAFFIDFLNSLHEAVTGERIEELC